MERTVGFPVPRSALALSTFTKFSIMHLLLLLRTGSARLPNTSFSISIPLFAHVRWSNFSSSDLAGLSRFRSVTVQVEPDAAIECEAQAQDVQARLYAYSNASAPAPAVLMYGNLFYSEPNCAYAATVAATPSLWLNGTDGKPYQPAGRFTFDMSNTEANVSEWWADNVIAAPGVDGGFGDGGCGGAPAWVNGSRADAWKQGIDAAHVLATNAAARMSNGSLYVVNCPILPQIGDAYIRGTTGEMIESWCSDFQPGGSGVATFCRDELLEALALSGWGNISLQARYYLMAKNKYNPQFGLAAFLIAAWHGAFFGASHDWDWAGDWANLLAWPWASLAPGEPLQPPTMLDRQGCAWTRSYPNANVSIDLCDKHLYARIDWSAAAGDPPQKFAEETESTVDRKSNEPAAERNSCPADAQRTERLKRRVQILEPMFAGGACPHTFATVHAPWAANGRACIGFGDVIAPFVADSGAFGSTLAAPAAGIAALSYAAVTAQPLPAWNYSGFCRFPAMYFGGDEAGPQSEAQLAFIARFALAGWGWQQGYNGNGGRHGEAAGAAAAAALRRFYPPCSVSAPNCTSPDATFVYRQSESLFTYYDLMANAAADPVLDHAATLHDPLTGNACGGGGLLAFSNATFTDYWTATVGVEITNETSVDAVFYDGFDKLYAGNTLSSQGCPNFDVNRTAEELLRKVNATAAQQKILTARGRVPILSTYNFFSNLSAPSLNVAAAAQHGAAGVFGSINGVFENSYAEALAGYPWVRFYEVWMGHGAAQDAAILENAIKETALGIPFVARTAVGTVKDLSYPAAAFLIAQGSHCYWGASSGWVDANWGWHGQYDWIVGAPLAPPYRSSMYVWERQFAQANVTVDVKTARGAIAGARFGIDHQTVGLRS